MTGEGNHNADRGHRFERDTARRLRLLGWEVVHSGASLGASDLIAMRDGGRVLLIQCKSGAKIMSHAEWNGLLALARRLGHTAIVADRPARGVYRFRVIVGEHEPRSPVWPFRVYDVTRGQAG